MSYWDDLKYKRFIRWVNKDFRLKLSWYEKWDMDKRGSWFGRRNIDPHLLETQDNE